MEYRLNLKKFLEKKAITSRKYAAYKDKETNQLFKEVDAFKTRLIGEIIICIIPIIMLLIYILASYFNVWKNSYLAFHFIAPALVIIVYFIRFTFVKFKNINSADEAKEARVRLLERLLLIIFTLEYNLVTYLVATNNTIFF